MMPGHEEQLSLSHHHGRPLRRIRVNPCPVHILIRKSKLAFDASSYGLETIMADHSFAKARPEPGVEPHACFQRPHWPCATEEVVGNRFQCTSRLWKVNAELGYKCEYLRCVPQHKPSRKNRLRVSRTCSRVPCSHCQRQSLVFIHSRSCIQ